MEGHFFSLKKMYFQDDIDMRSVWKIQVDPRPGVKDGYRNPSNISGGVGLENVDKLTDAEIKVLETPLERINQTPAWKAASKRRDEILAQIRNRLKG